MTNLPYYISEHDFGDNTDYYRNLMVEIYQVIEDLIFPIKDYFGHYRYVLLFENFTKVKKIPHLDNAYDLPISNYDPIPTWEKILRSCNELIERTILSNKNLKALSNAYRMTFERMQNHQKVNYFLEEVMLGKGKLSTESNILQILQLYNDIYEGEYKDLISFYHIILDILKNSKDFLIDINQYYNFYISQNIQKIKEYSQEFKLQHNINWILIGTNNKIRNAIAHKNWKLIDKKVRLWNIRENSISWEQNFEIIEIVDILKNIRLAVLGMQIGFLLPFVKYENIIFINEDKVINSIETLHYIFYSTVRDYEFILDDIKLIGNYDIEITLIDNPNNKIYPQSKLIKGDLQLTFNERVPQNSLINRAKLLAIFPSINFYGYKKVRYVIKSKGCEFLGSIEVDILKINHMFESKILNPKNFDSCLVIDIPISPR